MIKVHIYDHGAFDIQMGDLLLADCFPGIDGRPVRPVQVTVDRRQDSSEIGYLLAGGEKRISLCFAHVDGAVAIRSQLFGFETVPLWFHPVFRADAGSIADIYRQGLGIGGPSGLTTVSQLLKEPYQRTESFGIIALHDNEAYLLSSAANHDSYMLKYEVQISDPITQAAQFTAGFRMERVSGEGSWKLPDMEFRGENKLEEGLVKAAGVIAEAMGARTHRKPAYHWCSWYYWYHRFTHERLREYLNAFSAIPDLPLQSIQIDAGYFPSAGDWLITNEMWPEGMGAAFADIQRYGYAPGIWIGPYMVGNRSQLYGQHPDWVLHDLEDKPVVEWRCYNEPRAWGYADEEYYVLDTSHPDAMAYMRHVFRTFKEQGVRLFKTDFMLWGLQDSSKVKRHTPGKTSVQYFREFMHVIREEIGEDSYWLGCIAPFLPFVGYVDAMRIADDVGAQWNENSFGPRNMIREIGGSNYFNHVFWQNDPDAVMLRHFHIQLTDTEIESLALLQAVSGGAVYTSDPLHELSPERLELFQFLQPRGAMKAKQPLLAGPGKELVLTHVWPEEERALLLFFNPSEEQLTVQYQLEKLIDMPVCYIREGRFGINSQHPVQDLVVTMPPHGCKLIFASTQALSNSPITNLWEWFSKETMRCP
jgi:alpha-galactosidase